MGNWLFAGNVFGQFFANLLTGNFVNAANNDMNYFFQNPGFAHTTAHIENMLFRVNDLVGTPGCVIDLVNICGG